MRPLLRRLGRGLRESREPLLVFAVTRGALFLLAYLSLAVLPLNSDPGVAGPAGGPWRGFPTNLWLDGWARWDAGWYEHIATHGYVDQPVAPAGQRNLAFYPVYPLAMRLVSLSGLSPLAAGILVSNLAFLGALLLLHRMARARFGAEAAFAVRPPAVGLPLLLLLQRRRTRRACSCSWPLPRCSWASGGTGPGRPSARSSAAPRGCPGSPSRRRWASSTSTGSASISGRSARTSSGSG